MSDYVDDYTLSKFFNQIEFENAHWEGLDDLQLTQAMQLYETTRIDEVINYPLLGNKSQCHQFWTHPPCWLRLVASSTGTRSLIVNQ